MYNSKRPHGQAVKTSPSHGGIWGSIPHGGTKKNTHIECFFHSSFTPMGNGTLRVRNYVARIPEHWAGASLCKRAYSFRYYVHFVLYDSHGGTKKTLILSVFSFFILHSSFIPWGIAHSVCATMLHEPQKSGLAFRYMSKHTRSTITLTSFSTIPVGVPKRTLIMSVFSFFILHSSFTLWGIAHCVCATMLHEPQKSGLAFASRK